MVSGGCYYGGEGRGGWEVGPCTRNPATSHPYYSLSAPFDCFSVCLLLYVLPSSSSYSPFHSKKETLVCYLLLPTTCMNTHWPTASAPMAKASVLFLYSHTFFSLRTGPSPSPLVSKQRESRDYHFVSESATDLSGAARWKLMNHINSSAPAD